MCQGGMSGIKGRCVKKACQDCRGGVSRRRVKYVRCAVSVSGI